MKSIARTISLFLMLVVVCANAFAAGGFVSRTVHWKEQTTVYMDSQAYQINGTTIDSYFRYYIRTYYSDRSEDVYYAVDMDNQIVIFQIGSGPNQFARFVDMMRLVMASCEMED